jgi:hypothetical protein
MKSPLTTSLRLQYKTILPSKEELIKLIKG